ASSRRGIALVDKIRKLKVLAGVIQQRDIEVLRVHQLADDLMKGLEELSKIIYGVCVVADAIKRGLQLLGMFSLGDVECRAQHRLLSCELRYGRGEVEPAVLTVFVDDVQLIALYGNVSTHPILSPLLHHFALIGMDQIPGTHLAQLSGAVATDIDRRLIRVKEALSIVNKNCSSRTFSKCSEFALTLGEGLFGTFALRDVHEGALDHGRVFILQKRHVFQNPDVGTIAAAQFHLIVRERLLTFQTSNIMLAILGSEVGI